MSLFRRKSIDRIQQEYAQGLTDGHANGMKKILGVKDLTFMGIAAVIGAGIFSTIGSAAYNGGPGVVFLFLITAVTCGFTALCYAEFSSRIPVAGSAYTYSYVAFGEVVAWIIGWALILEYGIGNVVVGISWSAYFNNILRALGMELPEWLSIGWNTARYQWIDAGRPLTGDLLWLNAPRFAGIPFIINLPAFLIITLITVLAYIGISESKRSANFMVGLKLAVLGFIVLIGGWYIFTNDTSSNWIPFLPNGMTGVLKGVSAVFFAYIGFDAISTTAEECSNPQRDMPRGMLYSLIICTIIYVITTLVITGMVRYSEFNGVADPLAYVFDRINMKKIGFVISISAVVAATSVLLVFQIGQPRIWMSMSRDGLLPRKFSELSPRYRTPGFATIITGLLVGLPVLVVDDKLMTDLTSIGTLFAFVLVCGGVLLLPHKERRPNQFRLPYINSQYIVPALVMCFVLAFHERFIDSFWHLANEGYQEILFLIYVLGAITMAVFSFIRKWSLIPVLGALCCMYLMIEIPAKSWLVFFGWMLLGLLIYMLYGRVNSKLAKS